MLETTAAPASVTAALLGETIRAVLASAAGNGAAGGGLSTSAAADKSPKPADTLAALEAHLERMTALKEAVEALTRDLWPRSEGFNAEWYLLEARLWLAEAGRVPPAGENRGQPLPPPKPPVPEKP
jgi:hypothetical protein